MLQSAAAETEPETQFQPAPRARYERVNQVLKYVKESGITKFGFVGNEQYRSFEKAPGA
jgi:biopolymer transport protein ExbD